MKKLLSLAMCTGILFTCTYVHAQTDTSMPQMQRDTMMQNGSMMQGDSSMMQGDSSMMQGDSSMNGDKMMNKPPEDKSKRPSPPAMVEETTAKGVHVKIDYGQPSIKGREVGKSVEPHKDSVWRTGANEATTFEVDKDVKINGKTLTAGKYALFTIWHGNNWTVIFNKTWDQWGAFDYKMNDDALRVDVPSTKPSSMSEKMTFMVGKDGKVSLAWGNVGFKFMVM